MAALWPAVHGLFDHCGDAKSSRDILSISLLIAPGAIAVLLTQRFHIALLLAIGISVMVSISGVWLSFFIDSAPAPTIVVLFAIVFILTFTVTSINSRAKENAGLQDLLSPD